MLEQPLYGYIFFSVGIILFVVAFLSFLVVVAKTTWTHPPESRDIAHLKEKFPTLDSFNSYLLEEYVQAVGMCTKIINKRAVWFMRGVYCLVIGLIVIVVCKYGTAIIKV